MTAPQPRPAEGFTFERGAAVRCIGHLHPQFGNLGWVHGDRIVRGRWLIDVLWAGRRYVAQEDWRDLAKLSKEAA